VTLVNHNGTTYEITSTAPSSSEFTSVVQPAQQTLIQHWKWAS
jgi:hypothetical protein